MTNIVRVIVDECVGPESPLVQRFRQMLTPSAVVEFVWLAQSHRGIPDVELRRLLGPDAILLTTDRVLHNQVCDLGFRSYTLDERDNLRRRKLAGIRAAKPLASPSRGELKSDYVHASHPLAQALKQGMTENAFERYRTRRRRIRSYFGSEANIASAALTIGARATKGTAQGWLCGYFLRLAGKTGVKGLQASEGYSISPALEANPAWCLIHALRELYLLQLENVPAQIYVIPQASLTLCESRMKEPDGHGTPAARQALSRLWNGLAPVQIFPCVKGPFFERMERKLQQLACSRSNELVEVEFDRIINAINEISSCSSTNADAPQAGPISRAADEQSDRAPRIVSTPQE